MFNVETGSKVWARSDSSLASSRSTMVQYQAREVRETESLCVEEASPNVLSKRFSLITKTGFRYNSSTTAEASSAPRGPYRRRATEAGQVRCSTQTSRIICRSSMEIGTLFKKKCTLCTSKRTSRPGLRRAQKSTVCSTRETSVYPCIKKPA